MPYYRHPFAKRTTKWKPRRRRTKMSYYKSKQRTNLKAASGLVPYVSINPKSRLVKMRFSINAGLGHAISSSSGSVIDWVYRATGCYDPYAGAGGAQPRNYDQFQAMYRNGIVVKSKMTVEAFYAVSAAAKYPMKIGLALQDASADLSSKVNIAEHPRIHSAIITHANTTKRLTMTYTPRSFFDIKDATDEKDLYFTDSASPSKQAYFHICGYALDSQTEEGFVIGHIDYTVLFINPITGSQS